MKTTISSKGQIVLPAEFRQMDRIEPGQEFDVKRLDLGDYRLVRRVAPRNEGTIDWLLACPAQGFFCSHRI
jgi:bifunctional DNA-binding transcriptional regulator/antitoxin component of YhaV-PrlF toxin-antitoxin module